MTSGGAGDKTGADWSNALNGSNDGFHIDVKTAITDAVGNGATEVNVYFAGGNYAVIQQLSLASISIPVKLSGGYLAETDGSLEKGETETVFTRRTEDYIRFVGADTLSAFRIEGITFNGGYINGKGGKGGAVYLEDSATVISNCVFIANRFNDSNSGGTGVASFGGGGAVAAVTSGSLHLINSRFSGNYRSAGNANNGSGGAVYAKSVDLTVTQCDFEENYLDCEASRPYLFGAAIATYYGNVVISNCVFSGNYIRGCSSTGGASAGALAIRNAKLFRMSDSIITNCYVANAAGLNAAWQAGVMLLDDWYPTDGVMTSVIERCVFDSHGVPNTIRPNNGSTQMPVRSDIALIGGHLAMTNCLVSGTRGSHAGADYSIRTYGGYRPSRKNYAGYSYYTGGNWTSAPCSMELVNCTIADGKSYGAYAGGTGSEISLKNCIVYGNGEAGVVNATSIEYCCLQEEHEGEGNFVPESNEALNWTGAPYYHLLTKKSNGAITNGWFSGTFESKRTAADSPCIDAGSAGFPVGLEPEPNGRRVNLGAYGGTQWASMTSGSVGLSLLIR